MKNTKKLVLGVLVGLSALMTSCLFESDDSALTSWLSDQGLPNSYEVQTVSVNGLSPLSAEVFQDTFPKYDNNRPIFGSASNLSHELAFDFVVDRSFINTLHDADSATSLLYLWLQDEFYGSKYFPSDSFPIKEDLKFNVSWIISRSDKSNFEEKVYDIEDSVWYHSLRNWKPQVSMDTSVSVSLTKKDSLLMLEMPRALVDSIRSKVSYCRIQLKISAPDAKNAYRFYGIAAGSLRPLFRVVALAEKKSKYSSYYPIHMAQLTSNKETCADCLVLHGGVFDSLVVELPSAPIMKALSEFYGDEFPYSVGDSNDVRQAVILAQVTFPRDDSQGSGQLGLPVQVVVGSYVDSAGFQNKRVMEAYKLNKKLIASKGHPNMIFYEGDSLTLQVTVGMRDFLNKASDGRTFKMMMRLGYPVLQAKDSTYANYKTEAGDTSFVFFPYFDYARYDFSQMMKGPATLKLWLASKRNSQKKENK